MDRYHSTERIGVIETDRIVTKHLGWIFREQPIVDVGIDALIEQSDQGTPTGKFLAVQIKTGLGNFLMSEYKLTYYVSQIHYHYWLNLEIPIILIAHIPESEKTYWQHISEDNFRKTNKKWKIEIPKNQEFNEKAKNKLTKILSSKNQKKIIFDLYKGNLEPDTLFEFVENTHCIDDAVVCVNNITEIILVLKVKTNEFNIKLNNYIDIELNDQAPQFKASLKEFSKDINVCSKRLESEIVLFSELYSKGIYAYENILLSDFITTEKLKDFELFFKELGDIPQSVDLALNGIYVMRNGVSELPQKYSILKEAKISLLEIIDLIIDEFSESKEMAIRIREKLVNENNKM